MGPSILNLFLRRGKGSKAGLPSSLPMMVPVSHYLWVLSRSLLFFLFFLLSSSPSFNPSSSCSHFLSLLCTLAFLTPSCFFLLVSPLSLGFQMFFSRWFTTTISSSSTHAHTQHTQHTQQVVPLTTLTPPTCPGFHSC